MKKVAILTFQRASNYGAVLQAYALQQAITRLGVECEILDLLRPMHSNYKYTKKNARLGVNSSNNLKKLEVSFFSKLKASLSTFLWYLIETKRRRRFYQFGQTYINYSRESFCCSDDLYSAELDYDCYVTGSDQVWNPTFSFSPEPYFLTFAARGIPRIAYAPSFGINEIDKSVQPLYKQWLNDITHLSVRETHGAKIISKITGKTAQVVLDPTLLLAGEEWKTIAEEKKTKGPYIFCYALSDVPGLMELCYHLQKITGYPIYKIGAIHDIINRRVVSVLDAGPQEFLGYIKNASVVITNSFHGTVLSLNMQKPFYTVPSPVIGAKSRNSRLLSVLKLFSLTDRLYRHKDKLPSILDLDIAYDAILPKLETERERSVSFLRNSINSG